MTKVTCGTCTACCRNNSHVFIHEALGDDVSLYRVDMHYAPPSVTLTGKQEFLPKLSTKANGDCWYITDAGCSIYENRPYVCRLFDCRTYQFKPASVRDLDKSIEEAARQRIGTLTKEELRNAKAGTPTKAERLEEKWRRKRLRNAAPGSFAEQKSQN